MSCGRTAAHAGSSRTIRRRIGVRAGRRMERASLFSLREAGSMKSGSSVRTALACDKLTSTTLSVAEPAWSPDGSRLSFSEAYASYIVDLSKGETSAVPEVIPAQNEAGAGFNAFAWSPDGRRIAGDTRRPDGVSAGIVTYSIEKRAFERLTETGGNPRWLSDGRRLVYMNEKGSLSLVESHSKRAHELLSLLPDTIDNPVPSRDDRWIYFVRGSAEADLWLLTLK